MLPKKPRHLVTALGAVALLAIGLLLGLGAWQEYQQQLHSLKVNMQTEAKLLSEHATLSITTAGLVMAEVKADLHRKGLEALAADPEYWQSLRAMLARTPQLSSLIVVDTQGRVRLSSVVFPPPLEISVADRDYFQAHAKGEHHHIGETLTGRSSGEQLIPVSIRLSDGAGGFAGVMLATLDTRYFQDFYTNVREELDLRIGMFRRDGAMLLLDPPLPAGQTPYSREVVSDAFLAGQTHTWINDSPVDGVKKITSYRILDDYPIAVTVAYDYQAFLAGLYPAFLRNTIIFLVFGTGIALAAHLIRRSMRTAESARRGELKTSRLCQAIACNLPNGHVEVFDHELRYVFADGRFGGEVAGHSLPQTLGRTIFQIHPPEVSDVLAPLCRLALEGHESEAEVAFDGNTYKVITVPIEVEAGQTGQGLALFQNITALKETQRALENLSRTDGLLGIANRREFDRVLEQEWRRALRDPQPLSLLLIDIDCFKTYNDTYGHLAGDACLRQVAKAVKEAVVRPGDLVARYGGEELAVLLPITDPAGAQCVAERVQQRLAEEAIPFPASPVAALVTVSIGIGALQPDAEMLPAALITEADNALYAAKRGGRNRTYRAAAPVAELMS